MRKKFHGVILTQVNTTNIDGGLKSMLDSVFGYVMKLPQIKLFRNNKLLETCILSLEKNEKFKQLEGLFKKAQGLIN